MVIVNCVPCISPDGALSHEVCVCLTCQRTQKFDTSWYSACLCIVVPLGGPYVSGALSAFVRVSRQQKTHCHVVFVILCHVCNFSCQINNFQVQVLVQVRVDSPYSAIVSPMSISVDRTPRTISKRPLATLCQRFMVDAPFVLIQSAFFPVVRISPIAPKAVCCIGVDYIHLWAVAVWKFPSHT